jgi:hypothetical protein
MENSLFEEMLERHSGNLLDHSTKNVARHAVTPLGSGIEGKRHRSRRGRKDKKTGLVLDL